MTVNYGSGTPAEAAAWVAASQAPDSTVALWEIGNEDYGCWEVDNELAGSPAYFPRLQATFLAKVPMDS